MLLRPYQATNTLTLVVGLSQHTVSSCQNTLILPVWQVDGWMVGGGDTAVVDTGVVSGQEGGVISDSGSPARS